MTGSIPLVLQIMSIQKTEEIIQSIRPYLSTLSEPSTRDRPLKRKAIESVKKEIVQIKIWTDASTAAVQLLESVIDALLICTESAIESVREQAVGIIDSLVNQCQKGSIKNATAEKIWGHTQKRLKEELTEEVRLVWMELCSTLLKKEQKMSVAESEQLMDIMHIAGVDAFADVQKQCAKLIVEYAQSQPKSVDYACERMIRMTMPLLTHKHTSVRVSGIKAMDAVLIASPKGLHLLFEYEEKMDRQPIVPTLIYDASAFVRDSLFTTLGKLLCSWSPRHRYQYGEKIVPIILAGTFDELPSVQSTCLSSLTKVGSSCTRDMFDAGLIQAIPTDTKEAEIMGLKHLVHMCYNGSLLQLLEESTDFIAIKQETALKALKLFLSYASIDDLVKSTKRLVHCLFLVYANHDNEMVLDIMTLLVTELPSSEIYLEVLLPRLESKYLSAESNGFPGNMTVTVVMVFLEHLTRSVPLTDSIKQRILAAIAKPHLNEYLDNTSLLQVQSIKNKLS